LAILAGVGTDADIDTDELAGAGVDASKRVARRDEEEVARRVLEIMPTVRDLIG
jgi:hypothetical protein